MKGSAPGWSVRFSARLGCLSLFWRVFIVNAILFVSAAAALALTPATVSFPVAPSQVLVLTLGVAVMLLANFALLRASLAPLARVARLMSSVELLQRPGALPTTGPAEVAIVVQRFDEMLNRLEQERRESGARAVGAQEAERQRIAQDLHDEIGQRLTALLLQLERIARHAHGRVAAEIGSAQEMARVSLEEVRTIARQLRPGPLADLGLVSALRGLAEAVADASGLQVDVRIDDLPKLDREKEVALYRIAQEALTNVIRHAGAGHALLIVHYASGELQLRVVDDGRGINGSGIEEGAGIRGIRERALVVGGNVELGVGRDGRGTEVRLRVPVPEAAP